MRLSRLSEKIFGLALMTNVLANNACNRTVTDLQTQFKDAITELRSPPKKEDKCVSTLDARSLKKHTQVTKWVEMIATCKMAHDNGDRHREVYCIDQGNLEILSDISDVKRTTNCEEIIHEREANMSAFNPEIDGNVCYVAKKTCQGKENDTNSKSKH